jgi:uncharacterized protein YcsI (UPF0317 family)
MKKSIILILMLISFGMAASAQKYISKTALIRFYSDAPMEKIEASNRQVNTALDAVTGDLVFKVLMKSFVFEKALMQEHFNENYVESDKYPNATFLGKITNIKEINFAKDGSYNANVEGKLTIHGVTREVKTTGKFEVHGAKVIGKSTFSINLSDYNVTIPSAVVKNISNAVEITVDAAMDKLTQ